MSESGPTNPSVIVDPNSPIWRSSVTGELECRMLKSASTTAPRSVNQYLFSENRWAADELSVDPDPGLGLFADSSSWTNWEPDPWEFKSSDGTLLATVKDIKLVAVRYIDNNNRKKAYAKLSFTKQGHGWKSHDSSGRSRPMGRILEIRNSSGAPILDFEFKIHIWCDNTDPWSEEWSFQYDLWELLEGAAIVYDHSGTFTRC